MTKGFDIPKEQFEAAEDTAIARMEKAMNADPTKTGIFRDHNCAYCQDGEAPCVKGDPYKCEYPHARND